MHGFYHTPMSYGYKSCKNQLCVWQILFWYLNELMTGLLTEPMLQVTLTVVDIDCTRGRYWSITARRVTRVRGREAALSRWTSGQPIWRSSSRAVSGMMIIKSFVLICEPILSITFISVLISFNQSWSCKCLNGQIIFTVTWTFFIESESKQNWTEEKWLDTPARQYQYPCTLLIPWSLSNNQIFQKIVSLLSAKMHFGQASCSLKLTALKLPTYLVSGKMIGQKCLDHLDCINQVRTKMQGYWCWLLLGSLPLASWLPGHEAHPGGCGSTILDSSSQVNYYH